MKPHGRVSRRNARSSAVSVRPETPVMNARGPGIGAAYVHRRRGSRQSGPVRLMLHNAVAAGLFQAGAQLHGLFAAAERSDHGAIIDALAAEVGATNRVRLVTEHARI